MSDNVIFSYTRQQAIDDGVFVDASEMAKEAGIKHPVAITSNLFHAHICPTDEQKGNGQSIEGRQWDVLSMFVNCCKGIIGKLDGNMAIFPVIFSGKTVELWAFIEAQSPDDPSPAINIMLPEDY